MTKEQQQVKEFMLKAEQDCPFHPEWLDNKFKLKFRGSLIEEELDELYDAQNIVDLSDAIGDLIYVVIGTAVAFGIDIEPVFQEIHRSNMSKFIDGHRRKDGKWIKGPSYSPANLKPIIDAQLCQEKQST